MSRNIYNPTIPYVGPISGIISPGFVINIKGSTHPSCTRFGINLQCGPNISPRDEVSLHIGVDFTRGCVVRNSIHNMNWGPEETQGHFPFVRGAPFEIVIRCEPIHYNIAINGQHFTTFEHRIVYHRTTHLALDGDILIGSIEYQSESHNPPSYGLYPSVPNTPNYGNSAPYPPSPNMPYPQNAYPATHGQTPYGPTPMTAPMHGTQHPYMPHSPNASHQTHKPGMVDGLLKKVGIGGGTAATTAVLASTAGLGMLGGKKAWKTQKKARKKALKYGIPLAGAGLGAYAISRAFNSSSSSSSSSDEE